VIVEGRLRALERETKGFLSFGIGVPFSKPPKKKKKKKKKKKSFYFPLYAFLFYLQYSKKKKNSNFEFRISNLKIRKFNFFFLENWH
jgi:hypothetical protein